MKRLFLHISFALLSNICLGQYTEIGYLYEIPLLAKPSSSLAEADDLELMFETTGSFILVDAIVDGSKGKFILDSGAPGLILNESPTQSSQKAVTLTGQVDVGEKKISILKWGLLTQSNVQALTIDLSYLNNLGAGEIMGIIGYQQLAALTFTLDLPNHRLIQHTSFPKKCEVPAVRIPLKFTGHLPVVKSKIGKRKSLLVFDTGAGVNLLDHRNVRRINLDETPSSLISLRGLNDELVMSKYYKVPLLEIASGNWLNQKFASTDLKELSKNGKVIRGLLGRQWFKDRKITVDYQRKRILVY